MTPVTENETAFFAWELQMFNPATTFLISIIFGGISVLDTVECQQNMSYYNGRLVLLNCTTDIIMFKLHTIQAQDTADSYFIRVYPDYGPIDKWCEGSTRLFMHSMYNNYKSTLKLIKMKLL